MTFNFYTTLEVGFLVPFLPNGSWGLELLNSLPRCYGWRQNQNSRPSAHPPTTWGRLELGAQCGMLWSVWVDREGRATSSSFWTEWVPGHPDLKWPGCSRNLRNGEGSSGQPVGKSEQPWRKGSSNSLRAAAKLHDCQWEWTRETETFKPEPALLCSKTGICHLSFSYTVCALRRPLSVAVPAAVALGAWSFVKWGVRESEKGWTFHVQLLCLLLFWGRLSPCNPG